MQLCWNFSNRLFSRYVITIMLVDINNKSLISSFCSSTRICSFHHRYMCPKRLPTTWLKTKICNSAFHGFKRKTSAITMQCSSYVLRGVDLSHLKTSSSSSNQLFRFTLFILYSSLYDFVAFTVISMLINQV